MVLPWDLFAWGFAFDFADFVGAIWVFKPVLEKLTLNYARRRPADAAQTRKAPYGIALML